MTRFRVLSLFLFTLSLTTPSAHARSLQGYFHLLDSASTAEEEHAITDALLEEYGEDEDVCPQYLALDAKTLVSRDQSARFLAKKWVEPCRSQVLERLDAEWEILTKDLEARQARKGIFLQESPDPLEELPGQPANCDQFLPFTKWGITHSFHPKGVVSLTFDDGPVSTHTPVMLDLLKKWDIRATFFLQGDRAEKNPEIAKSVLDAGHVVGSHSFDHPKFSVLQKEHVETKWDPKEEKDVEVTVAPISADEVYQTQVVRGHLAVEKAIGEQTHLFRFPTGDTGAEGTSSGFEIFYRVFQAGLRPFYWQVDSSDWTNCWSFEECAEKIAGKKGKDDYIKGPAKVRYGKTRFQEGCSWASAHRTSFPRGYPDPESDGNPLQILLDRTLDAYDHHCAGIFLFHDVHMRTIRALPWILEELRRRETKLVQMQQPTDRSSIRLTARPPIVPKGSSTVDVCEGRFPD